MENTDLLAFDVFLQLQDLVSCKEKMMEQQRQMVEIFDSMEEFFKQHQKKCEKNDDFL